MKILFREEDIHVNSAVVIKVSGILFLKRRRGLSNAVHTFMVSYSSRGERMKAKRRRV